MKTSNFLTIIPLSNQISFIRLSFILLICFFLANGCVKTEDDETPPVVDTAFVMNAFVKQIGEADLFTQIRLYTAQPAQGIDRSLLVETDWVLTQLSFGETATNPGIETSVEVPIVEGLRLDVELETYENDPDGPSTRGAFARTYHYVFSDGCWSTYHDGTCVEDSEIGASVLEQEYADQLQSQSGEHPCLVTYVWNLEVAPND